MKFFSLLGIVLVLITFFFSSMRPLRLPVLSLFLHLVEARYMCRHGCCTKAERHSFECSKNHVKLRQMMPLWLALYSKCMNT